MNCIQCGMQNPDTLRVCGACGANLPAGPAQQASQAQVSTASLILPASLWQRLGNSVFDAIAIAVIGMILLFGVGDPALGFVASGFVFLYYVMFEALSGRTLGKLLTKTKVVDKNGGKASFGKILGRSLSRFIPFDALSFLFYGKYPTMGWHDRISGTLVVPKHLTPEQVRAIDPEKIRQSDKSSATGVIVAIVAIGFFGIVFIGIIASVILASLNSAQSKAMDAAIKAHLSNVRAMGLLWGEDNGGYAGICDQEEIFTWYGDLQARNPDLELECNDSAAAYAVSSSLNTPGEYFCIDSTYPGQASGVTTEPLNGATACPEFVGVSDVSAQRWEDSGMQFEDTGASLDRE